MAIDRMKLEQVSMALKKRAEAIRKNAFVALPGGQAKQAQDPAAMGGAPMDPAMAGGMPPPGMDPAMASGMPMDPAAMGGAPMDPAMAGGMPPPGMDPAMAGGMPMDPAAMGMPSPGMDPAMAGLGMPTPADTGAAGAAPSADPVIPMTLSQLMEFVKQILSLAKKVGSGADLSAGAAPAAPAAPASTGVTEDQVKSIVNEALANFM